MYKNFTLRTVFKMGFIALLMLLLGSGQLFAQETITDIDGNVYETVLIGNQRWFKSNLKVKRYRNGDPIPFIPNPAAFNNARFGAWCYFKNDPSTEDEFGLLYNAFALIDPRGLAPEGAFIPSACDWFELYFEVVGNRFDQQDFNFYHTFGERVKVPSFYFPQTYTPPIPNNPVPTNSSGLSISPNGFLSQDGIWLVGTDVEPGNLLADFWTNTPRRNQLDGVQQYNYLRFFSVAGNLFFGTAPGNSGKPVRAMVGEAWPSFSYVQEEQAFCGTAKIEDLFFSVQKPNSFGCVTGNDIGCYRQFTWFRDSDLTIPVPSNTQLIDGEIFFGKAEHLTTNWVTADLCETEILEVTVRILNPEPPSGEETQVFCAGATIEDLVADGDEIRWYSSSLAPTPLPPGTLLQNSRSYFAENRSGDCVNPTRFRVQVELVSLTQPTAAASQQVCAGTPLSALTVQGADLVWFDASGEEIPSGTLAEDNITYFVASRVGDCESQKTAVRVLIIAAPQATAPQIQEFCNTATVSNLQATGSNIRWYADQNLTQQLTPTSPLENGRTYYGTQTINGCEGPSLAVQVTVNVAATPVGATTQGFCTGARVSELVAQGNNIRWFTTATGGTALSGTELLENRVYYAEQTVNGCVSAERLAVQVTVSTIDIPAATASQQFCVGATIASIQVSGENIRWFASPTVNVPLSASEALVDGRTYYASQTVNGCESAGRRAVQIRVINVAPVTASASQSFCNAATVSNLQATGSDIRWYADQNLTTELNSNSPLENGRTYYATQSQNGCESVPVAVQVTIDSVTAPSGNVKQEFCEGVFVDDLQVIGSDVQWFTTPSGGSPLAGNLPLQDGVTYFAEQTIGACTSATRLVVRVRINSPQLPAASSQQEFCDGSLVSALQATGTNLVWYRNATGPELLNPNELIQDGALYYVSQRIGSCESARKEIRASIIQVQAPVVQEAEQIFCESEAPTISRLSASGEQIRWYSMETGGQPLSETERLQDGQTYYAANVSRGCESSIRISVQVVIRPCEVEVFNMVTRDGNSKNEYLRIKNIESFPENRLEIFNRYGVLVWAADGYGQSGVLFTGESNQASTSQSQIGLPTGNYLYVFTYKDPTKTLPVRITGYLYLVNIQRREP
ncbi:Ig-like domain-containing protein [Mongoliitalea daihaiensis]|uniref:Ig-like domain-containing protein n=1 Tax=Mongoliitalea daihaiensis TaxID=2782006 RepID=UPI001F1CAD3B|nr:FISUMP domain-containing protein [Mongoliitalea daihaiensis]UJP64391.1 gliding motility-associated C-terminal domain-containing protein [Mongoliitalea daihaiensis]